MLRHGAELAIFGATAVACAGYYSLLSGWSVWGWYFWPLMFLAYYLVLESIAAWREARASAWPLAAMALLGLAALALYGSLAREALGTASRFVRLGFEAARNRPMLESFGRKNVLMVDKIQRGELGGVARVQPGALIAMGDRAGSFGYFLGNAYRFIHTEGLVGPHDYVRALRADTGARYVDALRPDVLIAERERYFESAGTIGVAEPVQGWSVHTGPYLLCFDKTGIVASDGYAGQARLVIDYRHRTPCPADMARQFEAQRAAYGALREAALPSEYLRAPLRFVRAWRDALAASPASPTLVPAFVPVPAPATQP